MAHMEAERAQREKEEGERHLKAVADWVGTYARSFCRTCYLFMNRHHLYRIQDWKKFVNKSKKY